MKYEILFLIFINFHKIILKILFDFRKNYNNLLLIFYYEIIFYYYFKLFLNFK